MSLLDSVEGARRGRRRRRRCQRGAGDAAESPRRRFGSGGSVHAGASGTWCNPGRERAKNQSARPTQIKSVLGDEHIAAVANRLGISPDDASAKICRSFCRCDERDRQGRQFAGAGRI